MLTYADIHNLGRPYTHIHPYKQSAVKNMVDNVEGWVEYIIVFGSAAQPYCWHGSDIDVCIIGKKPKGFCTEALRTRGQAFDFLFYDSVGELIEGSKFSIQNVEREILEGGVVVYAKAGKLVG